MAMILAMGEKGGAETALLLILYPLGDTEKILLDAQQESGRIIHKTVLTVTALPQRSMEIMFDVEMHSSRDHSSIRRSCRRRERR